MKLATLALALCSGMVSAANWQLDSEQSSLHFVSVKNEVVAEAHEFTQLAGSWDGSTATVSIPVSSMQTNIPIRNERIWQYVLMAEKNPSINVTVKLSEEAVGAIAINSSKVLDLPLTVTIAGETAVLSAKVRISKLSNATLLAVSEAPLMLNTNSFKLTAGVAKLQELAGLKRIDPMVPVSFSVRFNAQ